MKQNQFEKFIDESNSRDVFELLNKRGENETNRWSISFTRKIMDQLIQAMIHGKTQPQAYYALIMARFGPDTLPDMVESILPKYLQQPWIAHWHLKSLTCSKIIPEIRIRQNINQQINESSRNHASSNMRKNEQLAAQVQHRGLPMEIPLKRSALFMGGKLKMAWSSHQNIL